MHYLDAKESEVLIRIDDKQASGRADGSEGKSSNGA